MGRILSIVMILLGWGVMGVVFAQDIQALSLATPKWQATLYAGPGLTFAPITTLLPGQLVNIKERNSVGSWVRVWQVLSDGTLAIDGWVLSSDLQLRASFDLFRDTPENTWIPDGDPSRVINPQEALLYLYPIMPQMSDTMRPIYEKGIANGNNPALISRVGDSLLMSEWYLLPMTRPDYQLGRYTYLENDLLLFGKNMDWSISAEKGMSTYTLFDATWANSVACLPNENPLACEYRVRKPALAFVMFGPNDVKIDNLNGYRRNLERIVVYSLEQGVIPVMMTFSTHPLHPLYTSTLRYNIAITEIAKQYDAPLLNVWVATRTLPEYGLEVDKLHLKSYGYVNLNFEDGTVERSGIALLNLLTLQFLHEFRLWSENSPAN